MGHGRSVGVRVGLAVTLNAAAGLGAGSAFQSNRTVSVSRYAAAIKNATNGRITIGGETPHLGFVRRRKSPSLSTMRCKIPHLPATVKRTCDSNHPRSWDVFPFAESPLTACNPRGIMELSDGGAVAGQRRLARGTSRLLAPFVRGFSVGTGQGRHTKPQVGAGRREPRPDYNHNRKDSRQRS